MKTKLKIITFCDYATMSQDNKLSIQGVFDQVMVSKFPGGVARAFFVANLSTTPNKTTKFSIKGKLGDKTIFPAIEMEGFVGETGNHNIVVDLAGLIFPQPGKYEFILSQDGEEIGSTELNVFNIADKKEVKERVLN